MKTSYQALILRQAQYTAFGLELIKLPYLPDMHICVTYDIRDANTRISLYLDISCGLHALAYHLAGFVKFIAAQFFIPTRGSSI